MFNNGSTMPFVMNVEPSGNGNGGNCNGMGGWGDGWVIWLFFILAIFWGGFGNGNGFGGGGANGSGFQGYATRSDINEGFALNNLQSGINAIQQGICDATYAISNQINGVNTNIMQSTNAIQQSINANTVANMQNFNSLQALIAQCCCENREAIAQVRYDMATQACDTRNTIQNTTRDIIENQNAGIRSVLDFLTQDKIASLTAENQSLKFQASQTAQNAFITANQDAQTAELIRRLGADCPIPAYVVPNPNCCYGTPYGVLNNGCGCNSGCGCA